MRRFVFASTLVCCCAGVASADQWADKMFTEKSVNFGAVPRAARIEHEFIVTNPYSDEIHIQSVRSSCGCTQPRIENDTLKTNEKGKIIAAFNTNAFTGQRGATVTVTFDRPRYAEVQLSVKGYIRTDVVLSPGQVNFGSVPVGEATEKKVQINHAGRSDWKITDVKSSSPFVTATVKELTRDGGRTSYELDVKLADGAPTGYLKNQLMLSTNDRRATQFPVIVEGLIVPELSVSPVSLGLGAMQPGAKVTKQLVVKGTKPFKIIGIECENVGFTFGKSEESKVLHLIPVTYEAGAQPGKVACQIKILTDLGDEKSVSLSAIGQINAPLATK